MSAFSYSEAFSRNIGWLTEREQDQLRQKRVAIAGLGGVGGSHLLTLARLGIGHFSIADFDVFDLVNFNRQVGATVSTLGKPKAEVMASLARDINPELDIRVFPEGGSKENLTDFLMDVDLYLDGLDFFAFDIRRDIFAACRKSGIPGVTVAPLGMGAALLNFLPGRMSFEDYFRLAECRNESDLALHFLIGLSPSMLQMGYLVDPSRVDFANHKGPSTIIAGQLCAGIAAAETLKILLERGKVYAAPWGVHFDGYKNAVKRTWRPGGNGNPLQRIAIAIARKQLAKRFAEAHAEH
ncbi:MAG: ThiF family adenylyltransferase [Thiobacillaceae bacterium]